MIHLIIGERDERQKSLEQLIESFRETVDRLQHRYLEDLGEHSLLDVVDVQTGLFGGVELFELHDFAGVTQVSDLEKLSLSPNLFFFVEDKVSKKTLDGFSKIGAIVHQTKEVHSLTKKQEFPIFALADALGERDKKKLWMLYRSAIDQGTSPEEINGILLWQLKNLAMVIDSPQDVPGMKPFVYSKNKRYAKNYTFESVQQLAKQFTYAFHNRDTYDTLDIQIERILLTL